MKKDEILLELNKIQGDIGKISGEILASIVPESGNQVYFDELNNQTRYDLRRVSKECYRAFLKIYEHI